MNIAKETITPKKAMEWLTKNISNRPLNQWWVSELAAAMTAGKWRLNGDCIRFNGTELIDGQHRLNAIVKSGMSIESYVVRDLPSDAYDTIDQGRKRKISDILARQGHKNYTVVSGVINWLYRYRDGMSMCRGIRPDEANAFVVSNPGIHECAQMACEMYRKHKLMSPSPLAFLIYVSSRRDPQSAEWWLRVVSGEGLNKNSPELALHHRLVANAMDAAKLRPHTVIGLCIKAWNFHAAGKSCKVIKIDERESFPRFDGIVIDADGAVRKI